MGDQLLLGVALRSDQHFDNFLCGPNQQVVDALRQLGEKPQGIYLHAKAGLGKSHLLNALCHDYHLRYPQAHIAYLPLAGDLDMPADVLASYGVYDLVCIDDVDAVSGQEDWEDALFTLFNALHDQGRHLVVTATQSLQQSDIQFTDLRTRLSALIHYELQELSVDQQFDVFLAKALEIGMSIESDVQQYVRSRGPRALPELMNLLSRLEKQSLQEKRAITIPFLKKIVDW